MQVLLHDGDQNKAGGDAGELCTTLHIPGVPNLQVSKSSIPGFGQALQPGGSINYTLTFDNSGGSAAAPVNYTDDLSKVLDDASVTTAPALATGNGLTVGAISAGKFTVTGSLAAGASATVTYAATVKKPDPGDHVLDNFVVPTGNAPPPACQAGDATCTHNPVADIALTKSAAPAAGVSTVGQTVTYTFTMTNTGQVPLSDVFVTDAQTAPAGSLASGPTCASVSDPAGACQGTTADVVGPGYSATFTATYLVTAADLAHGRIDDAATATGSLPTGSDITSPPATATVPTSNLVVSKSSSPVSTSTLELGDSVTYTLTFANTHGTVPAPVNYTDELSKVLDDATVTTAPALAAGSGLTVSSVSAGKFTVTGSLAAGATATATYTARVNNPDSGDHVLDNYVVPTGTTPPPTCLRANPDCTTHPVADIAITKSAAPAAGVSTVGQTVTYTFTVTNTGQVPLTGVVVNDTQTAPAGALASGPTCAALASPSGTCSGSSTALAIGQVATFTATYSVTAADLAHGRIDDSATATGTPPAAPPITSPPATATVPAANLSLAKSSDPASGSIVQRGDRIDYTVTLTNTGLAAATKTITDTLPDHVTVVGGSVVPAFTTNNASTVTWNVTVAANSTPDAHLLGHGGQRRS